MKRIPAALLLVIPSLAAALPLPHLPESQLQTTPFTLVANALDQQPKFDFFPPPAPAAVRPTYVDRMTVLTPGPQADAKMVHAPDPTVDYKLTVLAPGVGDGK